MANKPMTAKQDAKADKAEKKKGFTPAQMKAADKKAGFTERFKKKGK